MCVGQVDELTSSVRNTRDNVNSLFGWGSSETRGESKPGSVTNIYNYGKQSGDKKPAETKTPNRASLNTKGGNY